MAKDFFDSTIRVGDKVAFMRIGYRDFVTGKILSIAAKKCQILYKTYSGLECKTYQFHEQVIKCPNSKEKK